MKRAQPATTFAGCLTGFALAVGCAASPREPAAAALANAELIHVEGSPAPGHVCELPSRPLGCRTRPFQAMCATYLSADEKELIAIRESGYLNLRFRGDRGRQRPDAPVVPWRARRALVGGGLSVREVTLLAELVGGIESSGPDWPSERVMRPEAQGGGFSATAWVVTPEALRVIASIRDVRAVSRRWDAMARILEKAPAFGENSAEECASLLTEIVAIAREALDSNRQLYVVESLPSFRPTCQDLGGCSGYGCKSEVLPDPNNACHGENDECAHGFDCPNDLVCRYDQDSRRWACEPWRPDASP